LKQALISPHVLRLPNFSQQFVVECDACGDGLGAILSQNNQSKLITVKPSRANLHYCPPTTRRCWLW